jgi:gluconolactonase
MSIYEILHPDFKMLVDVHAQAEIIKEGFQFTEGPVWHAHEECLYFSDIPADTLYKYTDQNGVEVAHRPSGFSYCIKFP